MTISRSRWLGWCAAAAAGAALMAWWIRETTAPSAADPPRGESRAGAPASREAALPAPRSNTNDPVRAREPAAARPARNVGEAPAPLSASVVYGLVSTADGKPLDDASLVLEAKGQPLRQSTSQSQGNYAFAGVGPGTWRVGCRISGYEDAETEVVVGADPIFRRVDFTLNPKIRIQVRFVAPDGTPIAKALEPLGLKHGPWGDFTLFAVASREPIPRILPYTLGRGVYNFGGNRYREAIELSHDEERLPDGVDGALELKSPPPMFVAAAMKHMVFNAIEVKELVDTISLVVDPAELRQSLASVRFQIVDADTNDPVAAATATMGGYQTRTAGADGSLTFQHLTPGLLELRADGGKDYAATSRYVLLQPGEFQDVGRILLTKRATISGTVVDTQGKPIACSLAAQPEIASTFPAPLAFGIGYTTKADGRFELPVGRGPHVLLLRSGADDRASMRVDTSRGSVENVRCVLAPGTWVRFQTEGKDDPLFLLEILDSSGTPIQSRYAASGVQPALRLVPGTYNYRTRAFDGSVSNGTFNVRDSEANVVIRM